MADAIYRRERAHELWGEIPDLLLAHWEEIATWRDIPLDPDVEGYCKLEDAGVLRCYSARVMGELVGYAVFLVGPNPHYRNSIQARADVIFVHPDYRHGRVGLRLIQFADRELAAEGVQVVHHHVKNAHPALGQLLERMGYVATETLYERRLDDGR